MSKQALVPDTFYSLTLTLTSRCNLGCSYCYVPRDAQLDMDAGVARAAVDLLGQSNQDNLSLSFFGGEPFLALDAMDAALERASSVLGRRHFTCTTNGTVMGERAAGLVRDHSIELAMSIDGMQGPDDRSLVERVGSREGVARDVARVRALCPEVMARMTVTPSNVRFLVTNIRSLWDIGFQRIVYQPAVELDWDEAAIGEWASEHRKLGTWQLGLRSAGRPGPDLPSWNQVVSGLRGGRLGACGAGVRHAAVRTDGSLVPCYRLVFGAEGLGVEIGDVESGFTRTSALDLYASLTPGGRRPENGECASCEASSGCTYYCPAMAHLMLGDPRGVPSSACRLMRAQVLEVRRFADAARKARSAPGRRVMRWAAAAVAAAATTCITTGCGDSTPRDGHDEAEVTDTAGDIFGDAVDTIFPGVCPAEMPVDGVSDTEADPFSDPDADPPVDPVVDTIFDPDAEPVIDVIHEYYPGVCPAEMPVDAMTDPDVERDGEEIGPGVCPWPGIC